MNKQKLQNIAGNTLAVTTSEIDEIKQLISNYPFFPLPHTILAKIYFEKEHYLFENALNQAAMRVSGREWLYHYIHGDDKFILDSESDVEDKFLLEVKEPKSDNETIAEHEPKLETANVKNEKSDIRNDLSVFLEEADAAREIIVEEHQSVVDSNVEVRADESVEPAEIEVEETEALENIIIEENQPVAESNFEESAKELVEPSEIEVENTEVHEGIIEIAPELDEQEHEVSENQVDTTEEMAIETSVLDKEIVNLKEEVLDADFNEVSTTDFEPHPGIHLRKNPVYNVEQFLNNKTGVVKAEDESETKNHDFFYWLNHPKQDTEVFENQDVESDEESPVLDAKLSIIEQFIKANPSISRPKKEFYNAENMAKRSEHSDFEIMTETLANIFYEQGNITMAIKAYEKLSLQNPLKQAYFASLIEKIKKEKR